MNKSKSEFLGLFKSNCEQDLLELIALNKAIKQMNKNLQLTSNLLICTINGHSLYSFFHTNITVQKAIMSKLQQENLDDFKDVDERPEDHPLRRKVTQILTLFEPQDYREKILEPKSEESS